LSSGGWQDEDVVAARPETYHRLFAAAMVLFAGLDLLAKFFSGSDESRQTRHRFVTFVQRFMGLTAEDAETVWQVRNALMHSFSLYAPRANRTLTFHQRCPRPDLSEPPVWADGDVWHLCLHHLYNAFLRAIRACQAALATDAGARKHFHTMFTRYGSIAVRVEPYPEPQANP
jgi:hypothetical protein